MAPIDRSRTTSYRSPIVSMALPCTILKFFDAQNIVTLKSRLGAFEGHWKWHHLIDCMQVPSIVTMAVSCTVFEIKRDIQNLLEFLPQNLNINCPSP